MGGGALWVTAFALITTSLSAQTKVNKEWQTDSGLPSTFEWQASSTSADGKSALVGNKQNEATADLYVSLTDRDGTLLWEQLFDGNGDNDYGSAVAFLNEDIIVGGAIFDPANNDYDAVLLRISDTGTILWTVIFQGTFGGNDAITDITISDLGNIFVTGGSEGNGTLSDYHTMKLNGAGTIIWESSYDHQSLFDVPAAILVDESENVVVTGGSSSTLTNWDYATVKYDAQGTELGSHRMESGIGIDRPAAFSRTTNGDIHITGMASDDGVNYDIRTIKLNELLEPQWVQTFDEIGEGDEATGIDVDENGNVYVSGTITQEDGTLSLILICYDPDGNLLWAEKRPAKDANGETKGKDVKVVEGKVVVIGEKTELNNTNVITIGYDLEGNKLWEKEVDGGNAATDKASDVKTDADGNIYVSGKVSDGTEEKYTVVKYAMFDKPKEMVYDSTGLQPLFLDRTLVAKFSPDALIEDHVNKLDIAWAEPDFFLKPEKKQQLEDSTGLDIKSMVFLRIFKHLRTTDTISVSRLGEHIRIPEFWSTFLIVLPESWSVESTIATLNQHGLPVLEYAEYNRIITTADPPCDPAGIDADQDPDDVSYAAQQSLDPLPYLNSDYGKRGINIESAWCLATGKPHVRIGVMDTGLEMDHPDFEGPDGNVVSATYDYYSQSVLQPGNADPGNTNGHGSKVAGIIGAVRNNGNGVAGIAGGDYTNGHQGVQLQGHRILNGELQGGPPFGLGDLEYATDAIIDAATDPLTYPLPNYPFEPVHIMNHSWGIKEGVNNAFYTGLNINRLLYDAIRYSARNKVLNVIARGNRHLELDPNNLPADALSYPACYDDNWVLNVGATGVNGAYKYRQNGNNDWFSHIGGSIDLAAPGAKTTINTLDNLQGTTPFSGTSAAAPHVAGAAGLMLSYKNEAVPDNANLAPEDVEFLMEHTATDAMIPEDNNPYWFENQAANVVGYDDYIGHGRLDAGLAMYYLAEPWYDLRHYETGVDDIVSQQTISNVTLGHQLGYTNEEGVYFPYATNYTVEAFEYATSMVHTLAPNEQLALVGEGLPQEAEGIWPRHSSSNLMAPLQPGNVLLAHERVALTGSGNLWTGFVYHVFQNGVDKGWIPFNPNTYSESLQFAYSILVENVAVGIDETKGNGKPVIYPNPGTGEVWLDISGNVVGRMSVSVFDSRGKVVYEAQVKQQHTLLDLNHLNSGHYTVNVVEETATTHLPYIKL